MRALNKIIPKPNFTRSITTLFEERIVKQSIKLLKGEQDLELGIESIFVNWEKLLKNKNKKS